MEEIKFICDDMLGRLSRWLRIINCDTLYFNRIEDSKLALIARQEDRMVLTRDTTLADRKFIEKHLMIKTTNTAEQMRQVVSECHLIVKEEDLLLRCVICNTPILEVKKEKAEGKIPEYVYMVHNVFFFCEKCKRFYWRGSHYQRIHEALGDLIRN